MLQLNMKMKKIGYTPKLSYNKGLGTGLGPIDTMIGAIIDGIFS